MSSALRGCLARCNEKGENDLLQAELVIAILTFVVQARFVDQSKQKLLESIVRARRDALIQQIRSNPRLTIADLQSLAGSVVGPTLRTITIGDFTSSHEGEGLTHLETPAPPILWDPAKTRATRTAKERREYDAAMLAALRHKARQAYSATELGRLVGGTPQQIRRSLHRLIDAGKVSCTGRTSSARYRASCAT